MLAFGARKNTTQLAKYSRVLYAKPSIKIYLLTSKKLHDEIKGDLGEAEDKKLLLEGLVAFVSGKPPPLEQEKTANSQKVKDELSGQSILPAYDVREISELLGMAELDLKKS